MKKQKLHAFFLLHIILLIYSFSEVFAKLASDSSVLSLKFMLCYGGVIAILVIYALGWQQVIKRLPLTTAFANKAITVIWGIVWGMLFFKEDITAGKIIGSIIVITGVIMYVNADSETKDIDDSMDGAEDE